VIEFMTEPIIPIQDRAPLLDGSEDFVVLVRDSPHFIFLSLPLKSKRALRNRAWIVLLADDLVHFVDQAVVIALNFQISLRLVFVSLVIAADPRRNYGARGINDAVRSVDPLESINVRAVSAFTRGPDTRAIAFGKISVLKVH
jgi:hypothetical protein